MKYLTRQEELILLAVFHLRDNAYLVTIRKHLKEHSRRNWSLGAVYVPLERLLKKRYLKAAIGGPIANRGRDEIKYYRLTPLGLTALEETKSINEVMWARFSPAEYNL